MNLLDVEAVIIGGGLGVRLGEPFVDARVGDGPHLFHDAEPPKMHVAALGDSAVRSGGVCCRGVVPQVKLA